MRALVGAEATVAGAGALWLLVEDRTGYRNLCRLLTAAAAGRPKGDALATLGAGRGARGGTLLPRRRRGGSARGPGAAVRHLDRLRRHLRRSARRRRAPPPRARRRAARPPAGRPRRRARRARRRHQRRPPRHPRPPRAARRPHLQSGTAPRSTRPGACLLANAERHLKSPARDGGAVRRPAGRRSSRAVASPSAAPSRSPICGYRFPDYPLPPGETPIGFLRALTDDGARGAGARSHRASAAQLEHELALIEKLDLAGYFLIVWDIVRFCARARHPLSGPRLGRQQRRLLRARHHGGRCGRDGAALRALPLRGARRVARHRPRSAVGRSPRRGHPVRLPPLRRARRRHDRHRHQLPHAQRRARGRQGARAVARAGRPAGEAAARARLVATTTTSSRRSSATAASIPPRRASRCWSSWCSSCRGCRAISASTPAAW